MSHRCLFNEQACFFDDIKESSILSMCFRRYTKNFSIQKISVELLGNGTNYSVIRVLSLFSQHFVGLGEKPMKILKQDLGNKTQENKGVAKNPTNTRTRK